MREKFEWILFEIGLRLLKRSFPFIDVYSPKENVEAVTFAMEEKYIDEVEKIEL